MKYAINYYKGCPCLNSADEIIIIWHEDDTVAGFTQFLEEHPLAKIVISLGLLDEEFIKKGVLQEIESDREIVYRINESQSSIIPVLDRKFFFDDGINNWDKLRDAVEAGVSEVYITEDLGFDIRAAAAYCHDNEVKVRCYPNVAQISEAGPAPAGNKNGFWSFFIRPEDEYIYSEYIDTYEFWGPEDRQPVLMDIYKSHKWLDDLSILILGLNHPIMSYTIAPMWAYARTHCKHRCENCGVCSNVISLADTMVSHNKMFALDYPKEMTEHYIKQLKEDIALGK